MTESPTEVEVAACAPADRTPLPGVLSAGVDARFVRVWCAFLDRLAVDAEAALAAASAYRELSAPARETWIAALEQDVDRIRVPRIAVYAPLLAVETDAARRARIASAMGPMPGDGVSWAEPRALVGTAADGTRIAVLVAPLYLSFVRVLVCGFRPGERFDWVRHNPIVEDARAPREASLISGTRMDPVSVGTVVDELALVVVAHGRRSEPVPKALTLFADLFGPGAAQGGPCPDLR